MYYAYRIVGSLDPKKEYTGFTADLRQRLVDHYRGCNPATEDAKPWRLRRYFASETERTALEFEEYLKSGSGHAFARKRLWPRR